MSNLSAQAKAAGIATKIPISSKIRHRSCSASYAQLQSIEEGTAIYRGICDVGHRYDIRVQINKVKEKNKQNIQINSNGLRIGSGEHFEATDLEEY